MKTSLTHVGMGVAEMEFEPIFIAYASLIAMAMLPIYLGSYLSLENDASASDEDRLTGSDAYWFPVIGSVFLFSFYVVFKFLPKEYVNYLLTGYFVLFGTVSLVKLSVRFARTIIPESVELAGHYHVKVNHKGEAVLDFNVTWMNVLLTILCSLFSAYYAYTKNWIASNIFGEAFSVTAISMIHLDNFKTGIVLLAGLFFYDIFWVFGTDVMVTVAKNFDVPIKLLFPRDVLASVNANFSMLGLGDIVLPGVYLALCLKFDKHLKSKTNWYFNIGLIAYFIGLATTMFVMHTFKAAQPALLYLSPACILSSSLTALVRGQFGSFLAFESGEKKSLKSKSRASPRKPKNE